MSGHVDAGGSASGPPVVFVSYSREDAEWRRRFEGMLKPLVRERRLELWSDERNLIGEEWRPQLAEAIGRSRAALLLVSRPFLASDFIVERELPALRAKGALLVCVLVSPCLWDKVGLLERLQWAHDPGRDGPLSTHPDPEGQIVRVCERMLELLPAAAVRCCGSTAHGRGGWGAAAAVEAVVARERPGELWGVPVLPEWFVAREELGGLRAAVLRDQAVGITGKALGLHGQGGIGKTVLACALARDEMVRRHFPDGVFWVTVGERPDLVALQGGLLAQLGQDTPGLRSLSEGVRLLRGALSDRQCLVVVDDVWSTAAAGAFAAAGPRGRVLYTTRDDLVLRDVGAAVQRVDVLPAAAARELLAGLTATRVADLPDDVERVLRATGRVALALALVGAAVGRGGRAWPQVVAQLERGGETFLAHPYANTFKAMQVAVAALDPKLERAYASLAVYPEDTLVPIDAVARYWAHLTATTADGTREQLATLAKRRLLSRDGDAIGFHDLQRDFLLLRTNDLGLMHHDLLDAYRALLPRAQAPWRELPPREPYIWEHLIYHLRGAGDSPGVLSVATDVGYLALRAFGAGPHAAERDLRQAADLHPDDPLPGWLLRRFTQTAHLLAGHRSAGDLAATLATRLDDAPSTLDTHTLDSLLPSPWLTVRWGLPSAPLALTRVLETHTGGVSGVAFAPDGRTLASAGGDGTVRLWDTATGQPTATLEGHTGWVNGVAFAPDGRTLASAGGDRTVRLWDTATGQPTATLEGHTDWVRGVAFAPDGRTLASAGGDRTVRLWDTATGQPTATLEGHNGWVRGVAFAPDGQTLASASDDRTVRLWDTATGQPTATLEGHNGWVRGVAFAPDGQTLASASDDRTVRLWDTATGQPTATLEGHNGGVRGVAFAPDGQTLASASASDDRTVRLWDTATGQPTATLEGHNGGVHGVAFAPDGQTLASASDDGTVRLWDTASGQPTATLEVHASWVSGVAFAPDGQTLASASWDGTVRLWDTATGQPTATLHGHTSGVRGVAFAPDGRTLASAGDDGTVRLWDTATGQPTATLEGHTDWVRGVAFAPDGQTLASASNDGTVRLSGTATGQPTATLEGHTDGVSGVAFAPDGQTLASAGDDGTVRLWDTATGQPTATLEGHTGGVSGVAFAPDGRTLASASDDRTVRLWDTATGKPTATTLKGHTDWVRGVAFAPDGRTLASASGDGTVRLWDTARETAIYVVRLGAEAGAVAFASGLLAAGVENHVVALDVIVREAGPA